MKLTLHPTLVYRVPQFPYTAPMEQCWEELKRSISESSEFYKLIAGVKADQLHTLPDGFKHTIWKYFNRARFRATPYGRFAAFGICPDFNTAETPITISDQQQLHAFADWGHKKELSFSYQDLLARDCYLIINSTYYYTGEDIRFVSNESGSFELADVTDSPIRTAVLKACTVKIKISALLARVPEAFLAEEWAQTVQELISVQLLLSELEGNIIGPDYFERIDMPAPADKPKYIIAERDYLSGGIDKTITRHIPALMEKITQWATAAESKDLSNFISAFVSRFEERELNLMVALDPEMGVGYGGMEQGFFSSELIEQLSGKRINKSTSPPSLKDSLISLIFNADTQQQVIDLETLPLAASTAKFKLPNTTSMLCTITDELIQLEQLGGCSANSLLGRFTLGNDELLAHCQDLAAIEAAANPDVLFFDIAYMAEGRVDNVNRRRAIYDVQLSILNYDTAASPLALNDLMLSVRNNELVLRSASLGKRLVPRLATAYNYQRSDLSVFRLFCDLQHQGLKVSFKPSLKELYPGQAFYPRLQFKNIILSPASWRLKAEDLRLAGTPLTGEGVQAFLTEKNIPRYLRFGMADLMICIDRTNLADCTELLGMLQKQKEIYLEEVLMPVVPAILDSNKQPYLGQFLFSLSHQEKVYEPARALVKEEATTALMKHQVTSVTANQTPAVIPPGKDWLYFEIYSHPYRANALLLDVIQNFITQQQQQLLNWFFIRYNENGEHIRLRIRHLPASAQALSSALSAQLEPFIHSGLVKDLLIRTYRREMDRYGSRNIEKVEAHFCADSNYVLQLLARDYSELNMYKICTILLSAIDEAQVLGKGTVTQITQVMAESFSQEHHLNPDDFKKLNELYKTYQKTEAPQLDPQLQEYFKYFQQSLITTLDFCQDRPAILTDLFHMHINRIFPAQQRTHEMTIYYFFKKDLLRKKAMETA